MKIPGFNTILVYQFIVKKTFLGSENVRLFAASESKNSQWVFEYFPENICAQRWKEGNKLFYLLNNEEEPCSFAWFKQGTEHFVGELNRKLIFKEPVNCIFDCITPTNYRGRGYYTSLINQLPILENEYPCIIYASSSNVPSNRGIVKAGFELTNKISRIFYFVKMVALNNSPTEFNVSKAS